GQATSVTFGSSDGDSFGFDPNTGRMTSYQFSVNGQSNSGALTWNPNGTLLQLNITDQLNSADTQNCGYVYDDLQRISSVLCGTSIWGQNFTYDPFGNIVKNVPTGYTGIAFQPGYSTSSNQITSLPGLSPAYD